MKAWIVRVISGARLGFSDSIVGVALATVSFCSGLISYTHICALTADLGGSWKTAHLMPLAVDGQIVIGSAYYMKNDGRRRRWLGLLGFVPGVLESLFANWQSGIVHGLLAAGWSTVPAQAFACSAFLFERWLAGRRPAAVAGAAAETAGVLPETSGQEGEPSASRPRPSAVSPRTRPAAADDTRLPLPEDTGELAALVRSTTRNDLFRTYQVSKTGADKLKARFPVEPAEEVQPDDQQRTAA